MNSDRVPIRFASAVDAPAIARVHVDAWRTTYRGIVPDAALAGLSYERRERMWADSLREPPLERRVLFVADDPQSGIIGFAAGGPESSGDPIFTAELYAIYILEAWQRKGLGKQLFSAVAGALAAAGFSAMSLWVLAENDPARRFYESLAGRLVKEQTIEIGGAALREVAYGWEDLPALARRLRGGPFSKRPPR